MNGIVFDIKEGAVHDGPGLRQTVFMKGCPLRCVWCHNPEGLRVEPELMVSQNGCTHCNRCKEVCTHESCNACGKCVTACPLRLRRIVGQRYSSKELSEKLAKNVPYYRSVGGGITFSGGEPLLQWAFIKETIELLEKPIHYAIETSGFAKEDVFASMMQHMDLIMMDVKLMDDKKHKHWTGVSNEPIFQNLQQLMEGTVPFIIRIPLIPTVNDNAENFHAMGKRLQHAKALLRVEMLPYHVTAGAKYAMLGRSYEVDFPQDQSVHTGEKIFAEYGIRSNVL